MKSNRGDSWHRSSVRALAPYDTRIFVCGMPQLQANAPPETQTSLNLIPGP
jgi:hypothetical protein